MQDFMILTNNSIVLEKYTNTIQVDGDFIDVLNKAKELVNEGYKLISYPLGASIRIMYSPIRSILVSKEKQDIDLDSMQIINSSIEKYKITMGIRKSDKRNRSDYEVIDYDFIISAINEINFIKNIHN